METVFIKLLNMSIAAGWLVLAALLLRALIKKAPKAIRLVLWALVGLRLVLPFSLQSVLSLVPSAETVSPGILYAHEPTIQSGIPALNQAINPTLSESLAPAPDASANPAQIALGIASAIWFAGALAMLLYAAASYLRLRRRVRAAVPIGENLWRGEAVESPFVLGLFRPRIYLPADLEAGSLAHVLAHERAHILRRDHWIKPAGFLLLSVYWFNPLMWLAYVLLCRDIELACDERVVRELKAEEKKAYSQALLACSLPRRGLAVAACPLAFGEVGVRQRIKNVLTYKKPAFWLVVLALAACVFAAVCFLTNPVNGEQDLSFLNYKNAVSIAAQEGAVQAVYDPGKADGTDSAVVSGTAEGAALAQYLEAVKWREWPSPAKEIENTPYVEFAIWSDYSVTIYQNPRRAAVFSNGETRFYKTRAGDYEAAAALVRPAEPGEEFAVYSTMECVYQNPLSSSLSLDGDDGRRYTLGENSVFIENRQTGESVAAFEDVAWNWQPFSRADWAALFAPPSAMPGEDFWAPELERHALSATYHLLRAKNSYWIMEVRDGGNAGPQVWSIYALEQAQTRPRMTLEVVLAISELGDTIAWDDLSAFAWHDIGSGRYIYTFPVEDDWWLMVNSGYAFVPGRVIDGPIMLVYLPDGDGVDIRAGDVVAFIAKKERTEAYTGPLMSITLGGETIAPYENLLWASSWTDGRWLEAEGKSTADLLPEIAAVLPTLTPGDDLGGMRGILASGASITRRSNASSRG